VCAALIDPETGCVLPQASVGWDLGELGIVGDLQLCDLEPLLDEAFEREGCYLLPNDEARRRLGRTKVIYASQLNGSGPWAWNRHWLVVPLRDGEHGLVGLIWVDDPADRLLPPDERLQALRIFANDAAAAPVCGRHHDELRFLA